MTKSKLEQMQLAKELIKSFTEEEIAVTLNVTIAEVRQMLPSTNKLSYAAWQEMCSLYPDENNYTLTKLYNCNLNQLKKYINGKTADKHYEVFELQEMLMVKDIKEVSKITGIPVVHLKQHQVMKYKKPSVMPSKEELLALEGTHAEIADQLGVCRSWVTKKISDKHKPSTPNKIKDWDEVLEYLKANSLKSTAKRFGVTPSAIINWRKRNDKRT